jgi:hypothetical protein
MALLEDRQRTSAPVTRDEHQQLVQAFERTPSLFKLLSSVRTRRMGKGFTIETGVEEIHAVTGRPQLMAKGPCEFVSEHDPQPLSEIEEALIMWAAGGPNGTIAMDLPTQADVATFLCVAGRTIPGPCNDSQVHFFIVNDNGLHFWYPTRDREKPVEIETEEDYDKVLKWYREGLVTLSDQRSAFDLSWGVPNQLMGAWQWNFNKPGTTCIIPVSEHALEQVNLLLTFYEWNGWYFVDDDGEPHVGADFLRDHPQLTLPFPLSMYEEFMLHIDDYVVGYSISQARLAAESLGVGAYVFCGFSENLMLGALPEIGNGLGFTYNELSDGRRFAQGLPGVFQGYGMPAPWWDSVDQLVDTVVNFRYNKQGVFFGEGSGSGSSMDNAPYNAETLKEIRKNDRLNYKPWAIEAAKRDIQHCLEKYGRYPVHYAPMQCNHIIQLQHVDTDYYDKYHVPGYMNDRIRTHDDTWHNHK